MVYDRTLLAAISDINMRIRIVIPKKIRHPQTIILAMGYRGHLKWWPEALVQFLAKTHQVILFDNRGAGQSERGSRSYSIGTLAQDLGGIIDHLGLDKAVLMGVSMGGMIVMDFASKHPEKVEKLIVANSMRRLKIKAPWNQDYFKLVKIYTKHRRVRMAPLFLSLIFTPNFLQNCPDDEWDTILTAFNQDAIDPKTSLEQLRSIVTWRWRSSPKQMTQSLRRITCPCLVLSSDQDLLCPPQNSFDLVKDLWDVHHVRIKGQGHALLYEALDQVVPHIDQFLSQSVSASDQPFLGALSS